MTETELAWDGRGAVKGGAIAGLTAGVVLTVVMQIEGALQGQNAWAGMKSAAFPFLHERALVPGFDGAAVALGLLCHFAVSAIWGLLFGLIAQGFSRPATVGL